MNEDYFEARNDQWNDEQAELVEQWREYLENEQINETDYPFSEYCEDLQNAPNDLRAYGYAG